jgi:hypothetical protein
MLLYLRFYVPTCQDHNPVDVQGRLNRPLLIIFLGHYEYLDKSVLEGKAEQTPNRRSSCMQISG